MYKAVTFLFYCSIFVGQSSFAQSDYKASDKLFSSAVTSNIPFSNDNMPYGLISACGFPITSFHIIPFEIPSIKTTTTAKFSSLINFMLPAVSPTIPIIPANFYTNNLSFFCEKEWKFEKATSIPFKFRLGSVSQVDFLEGKPNSNHNY